MNKYFFIFEDLHPKYFLKKHLFTGSRRYYYEGRANVFSDEEFEQAVQDIDSKAQKAKDYAFTIDFDPYKITDAVCAVTFEDLDAPYHSIDRFPKVRYTPVRCLYDGKPYTWGAEGSIHLEKDFSIIKYLNTVRELQHRAGVETPFGITILNHKYMTLDKNKRELVWKLSATQEYRFSYNPDTAIPYLPSGTVSEVSQQDYNEFCEGFCKLWDNSVIADWGSVRAREGFNLAEQLATLKGGVDELQKEIELWRQQL